MRGRHQSLPQRSRQPAGGDACKYDGEHHGKGDRMTFDEEQQESEPDDLEGQQTEAGKEDGDQWAEGAGGELPAGSTRRWIRSPRGTRPTYGDETPYSRGDQIQPAGSDRRSAYTKNADEICLADYDTEHRAQRVPAVQPSEDAPKPAFVLRTTARQACLVTQQRLRQQRQR